ncbi:hypothetical protein AB0G81_39835, partial [Streptomyces asoensis]
IYFIDDDTALRVRDDKVDVVSEALYGLRGWVGAAVEERPELAERAEAYLAARLAACAAGDLQVTVHHSDLLALARPTGTAR